MHCGDQRHLGLRIGYVPALAYGSCRVSDQGTTLRASDLHNARATILNPFSKGLLLTCNLEYGMPQNLINEIIKYNKTLPERTIPRV